MFNLVYTKKLSSFSAKLLSTQPALVPSVIHLLEQDTASPFVEFHEVLLAHFSIKVPLKGSTTIWYVSHSSQFGVIWKLVEGELCPILQVHSTGPNMVSWGTPLLTGL